MTRRDSILRFGFAPVLAIMLCTCQCVAGVTGEKNGSVVSLHVDGQIDEGTVIDLDSLYRTFSETSAFLLPSEREPVKSVFVYLNLPSRCSLPPLSSLSSLTGVAPRGECPRTFGDGVQADRRGDRDLFHQGIEEGALHQDGPRNSSIGSVASEPNNIEPMTSPHNIDTHTGAERSPTRRDQNVQTRGIDSEEKTSARPRGSPFAALRFL
jgi:hypothetical protein